MRRTAVLLAVAPATLLAAAAPGWGAALIDFDGNGFDDLAVGAPGGDVGTAREAGAVTIMRGLNESGFPTSSQLFTQGRVAGGQPEPLDNFGAALA
jgi:FG-GAP repeat